MGKVIRQSNFELLRILAAVGVVILHFIYPRGIQNVEGNANTFFLLLLESLFISCVDIFIMLSAFFLINRNERKISKPLDLLIQLELIQFVCFIFFCYSTETFSLTELVTRLVPVDYFVTLYIALYFISPYINKIVIGYDNKEWKKLLFISMTFLSFLPIASDILTEVTNKQWLGSNTIGHWGGQFGHTLINFVLVYIIGGYLSFTKYVIVSKRNCYLLYQFVH